jgi:hypothetical protein
MAAVLTITVTKGKEGGTASLTGGPASASVNFNFAMPGGGVLVVPAVTSGAGAAMASFVPNSPGIVSCNVTQPVVASVVGGPVSALVA